MPQSVMPQPQETTESDEPTVAELGEDRTLALLLEALGPVTGPSAAVELAAGDDAAVLSGGRGRTVLTTDSLIEGQDVRAEWFPTARDYGAAVGHKAIAQNLSDVVAMGAEPTVVLLSLVLPAATSREWIIGFAAAVREDLTMVGAQLRVAGGDLGSGPVLTVTVTALGELTGAPLRRDGARPGDVLAVGPHGRDDADPHSASPLGSAAAGLVRLEAGRTGPGCGAQLHPRVEVTAGVRALAAGATAGMDVSDGLLRDAARLAAASGVVLDVQTAPVRKMGAGLSAEGDSAAAEQALRWMLTGGEDYVLLAAFPPEAQLPSGFTVIGHVCRAAESTARPGTVLLDGADSAERIDRLGWDSLS